MFPACNVVGKDRLEGVYTWLTAFFHILHGHSKKSIVWSFFCSKSCLNRGVTQFFKIILVQAGSTIKSYIVVGIQQRSCRYGSEQLPAVLYEITKKYTCEKSSKAATYMIYRQDGPYSQQ